VGGFSGAPFACGPAHATTLLAVIFSGDLEKMSVVNLIKNRLKHNKSEKLRNHGKY
jgi:hypothetical protein